MKGGIFMRKRWLALLLAVVMVFSLGVPAYASEPDPAAGEVPSDGTSNSPTENSDDTLKDSEQAEESTEETSEPTEKASEPTEEPLGVGYDVQALAGDTVATLNGTPYHTITEAVTAAGSEAATIEVTASTTENVVIPAGANITLNLPKGVTLSGGTVQDSNGQSHTITNNGKLTVTGEGTLENKNADSGVVFNTVGATANLNGCTFTGNTWYVLKNLGTMNLPAKNISGGPSIVQQDSGSSAIANGWDDYQNGHQTNDCGVKRSSGSAKLNIYGGTFSGGMNTVENDDYGILKIYDGTFTNTDGPVVLNWHSATIEGGSFTVNGGASSVIANGYLDAKADKGDLTINGGTFTASNGGTGLLFGHGENNIPGGSFRIKGGTFNGSVAMDDTYSCKPVVTGAVFTDPNVAQYAKEGNTALPIEGSNTYTIGADESESSPAVAKANGLGYTTVQDAVSNAGSGGKVTLLKDADTGEKGLGNGASPDLTLDLAGHILNLTGTNSDGSGFSVNRSITVQNGTICDKRSSDNPDSYGFCAILVSGKTTALSLNQVEIVSHCPASETNTILCAVKGGQININAGTVIRDESREKGGSCIGVVIEGQGNDKPATQLTVSGGTINLKGCCISGNGTMHNTEITIENGSQVISSESLGIYHPQEGTLNVNGGTISGITGIEMRAGTLNVTGGTITGTAPTLSVTPEGSGSTTVGAGIAVAQHTTKLPTVVNISGGDISGAVALNEADPQNNGADAIAKVEIHITDGSFTATDSSKQAVESETQEHFISGGTFSTKVPENFCAPNLVPTDKQADNTFTVTLDPQLVAVMVEGTGEDETVVGYYKTLQEAINAVTGKCTIRLIGDITENVTFNYTTRHNVNLDLNGHTLDGSITNTLSTLEIRDNSGEKSGRITGDITNSDAQYSSKAALTRIYGGHIGGKLTKGQNTKLWAYEAFYKEDPSAFMDAGYVVKTVSDGHGCAYQIVKDQAAKIVRDGQEIIYQTLSKALSDAKPGETVVLLKDFTGNSSFSITKAITVDLNGCTVTGTQPAQVFTVNGYPNRIDVTIRNGKIIHAPGRSGDALGAVYARQNCNLTLEDVKITSNADFSGNGYGVRLGDGTSSTNPTVVIRGADTAISAPTAGVAVLGKPDAAAATLVVENGTVTGGYYGIAGNGSNDNTSITVSGGTVNGDTAIYHPQDGNLTITGGSITGKQGVQFIGAGKLTISGGSITATADALTGEPVVPTTDGSIADGAAVSIISRGGGYGAAGNAEVSITGGNITSDHNVAIREYGASGLSSLAKMMRITQEQDTKLMVTGGDDQKTAIKLGILSGDDAKVVSGGSFSSKVPDEYCAENFRPTNERSDGTYSVENEVDGHAYDESVWQYNETQHYHLCTICEEEKSAAADHTFEWVVEKAATCTEVGSRYEACSVCGYKKAPVEIPVIAHVPGSDWKSDKDSHWHECTNNCGEKLDQASHTFGEWTPVTRAVQREETRSCTVCGYTETRTVTVPEPTDPQPTDPQPTDPQPTDPQPTDPQPTDPQPTDPQPTDPQPTDPQPTDPQPTDPQPTDPQPTDPQPTDPQPTDPQPTDPKPTDPQPTDPQPTDPQPTDPQPTDPQPTDPQPTDPQPTDPQPTDPQPTEPKPTDPKPTEKPDSPATGDNMDLGMMISLMVLSLLGAVALILILVKRNYSGKYQK